MDASGESSRSERANRQSSSLGTVHQGRGRLEAFFFGAHGLRPLWRFVLYTAAFYGLSSVFLALTQPLLGGRQRSLWFFLVAECDQVAAAFLPALALMRFEGRPFGAYGLPLRADFLGLFLKGAAWGLAAISVLVLTMRGMGILSFGGLALLGPRVVKFGVFWAVLFLVGGLFEEFRFRGYSQFTLAQSIGFWPAALLLSAGFGWEHLGNQGESGMGALGAAAIALFWCLTLRRTGSLWFSLGMHATWNWGETFLYSVPNSGLVEPGHLLRSSLRGSRWLTGGSVGPEGSVLLFFLIALMWLVFDRLYPAQSASAGLAPPAA